MAFEIRKRVHDVFYDDVRAYLQSCGYLTESSTYHEHWSEAARKIVRTRFDPTTLYARFRADNTAIGQWHGAPVFEWDAKTNISPQYANMALEAVPLAIHKALNQHFGVRCLYCYYDAPRNRQAGFWIADLPPVSRAIIATARYQPEELTWYEQIIRASFPDAPLQFRDHMSGSETPLILIDHRHVLGLPDWKSLIPKDRNG